MMKILLLQRGLACIYRCELRKHFLTVALMIASATVAFSQVTVSGTVRGDDNLPLPGASISVKGTSAGTITGADGKYSLVVPSGGETLVFTFIGMESKEVPIGTATVYDVTLMESAVGLEEVVVVGYGEKKKVNLTGSVDQLDGKMLENFAVPNVARALQGQIPGLNITFNNGRPNSSPAFNIRGVTSIGAGGSALVLIDGAEGDPSTINPDDIESITVLKDAASAAIYGSRGAFGVVLITTKKPGGQTQLKYTATVSTNSRTATREVLQDSYLWSKMYMESFTELYGGTRTPTTVGTVGINFSQEYLQELQYRSENPDHDRPDVGIDPATGTYMYYGNTNWWDLIYEDNIPSTEHTLTASGGSDQASYYVSGRYFAQDGLFKIRSDKYDSYDFRMKGSVKPLPWLNIDGNMHYSNNTYSDPFAGDNVFGNLLIRSGATPMGVPFNPDGSYTQIGSQTIGLLEGFSGSKTRRAQVLASAAFDATIIKNTLNLQGNFTFRNSIVDVNQKFVPVPYSNVPGQIITVGDSRLYDNQNTLNYLAYNVFGTFQKTFGRHAVQVVAGTNIETSRTRFLDVNRSNLIIPELDAFNLATGENFNIGGGGSDWANAGIFSRISYAFKDRYLLEINSRYDGSSKFPASEQFGFFPSFSVGWRISEESFMDNTKQWLDNLKPRLSYGSLGNSQISPYMYVPQIRGSQTSKVLQGQRPVATRNPLVLADGFTWETSTTLNVGLDVGLFRNRLGVVYDWFERETTDMITAGPILPAVFGASSPQGNYADLVTKGFELSVSWNDQIQSSKPFRYGIQVLLADDISEITRFNNPQGTLIIHPDLRTAGYYEGMQIGEIWGLTTMGLFVDQADIDNHVDQTFVLTNVGGQPAKPGDVKFADIDGDGKVNWGDQTIHNPGDLKIIGNSSSRYKFGLRLNGAYGNFSLSTFFQGVGKRDWYPTHHQNPFWGPYGFWAAEIPVHFLENSYTAENPDPNAYWPRWKGNMAYGNRQLQPQTRYLQNTAYVRLKELTLAYSSPHLAQKIGMKNLQLSLTGYNIWTYSPVFKITRDIDPEQLDGNVGTYYPMLKSYNLALMINF